MDVDGEYLLVGFKRVGDIRGAQQLTGIELNQRIGIAEATFIPFLEQVVDYCGIAIAMEAHLGHGGGMGHLLRGLLGTAGHQQHDEQQ